MSLKSRVIRLAERFLPEKGIRRIRCFHYYRKLRKSCEAFEVEFEVVKHLVTSGDYTIDVGANYGLYTEFLSRLVGRRGRVYSIEPVPSTFEVLSYNVRKLGLRNVTIYNCAISKAEGELIMKIPRYPDGRENYYRASVIRDVTGVQQAPTLRRVVVPSKALDTLFKGSTGKVSFLKIDVEGHEMQVLEGAKWLLRHSRPACLVEIAGDPDETNSSARDIFNLLRMFHLLPHVYRNGQVMRRTTGMLSTNYFFLSDEHVDALRRKNMLSLEHESIGN